MQPRSIVLNLYGDYIRYRQGEASVRSILRLMEPFEVGENALRATLSRMSSEGWLTARRNGRESSYSLTARAWRMLDEGRSRIFEHDHSEWNGEWFVLVYSIPEERKHVREALRKELAWLGFGMLAPGTWICPYDRSAELQEFRTAHEVDEAFIVLRSRTGSNEEDRSLVTRCWYLPRISDAYAGFVERYEGLAEALEEGRFPSPADSYLERMVIVHEYRKFPFIDPELPRELLPEDWPGHRAHAIFDQCYRLLSDRAFAFVDDALTRPAARQRSSVAPISGGLVL